MANSRRRDSNPRRPALEFDARRANACDPSTDIAFFGQKRGLQRESQVTENSMTSHHHVTTDQLSDQHSEAPMTQTQPELTARQSGPLATSILRTPRQVTAGGHDVRTTEPAVFSP